MSSAECFGKGIVAAILAGIFAVLFFSALWWQFKVPGLGDLGSDVWMVYVQYVLSFIFLGLAKWAWWSAKESGAKKKR